MGESIIKKNCIITKRYLCYLTMFRHVLWPQQLLEGEQRMCLSPEGRGLSSADQPSQCPFHPTLSLQRIPNCPSTFPVKGSEHIKARRQCWCPTPHHCSIFQECTCVNKHSVLPCHWYSSHLTEGRNCWLHPNLKICHPGQVNHHKSGIEVHELDWTQKCGMFERCMVK